MSVGRGEGTRKRLEREGGGGAARMLALTARPPKLAAPIITRITYKGVPGWGSRERVGRVRCRRGTTRRTNDSERETLRVAATTRQGGGGGEKGDAARCTAAGLMQRRRAACAADN